MQVPELGILERDALDRNIARILDDDQPNTLKAEIGEIMRIRGHVAQLPEHIPNRTAGTIERSPTCDLQPITTIRIDQGRGEACLEMPFDSRPLARKVFHVRRAFEHRTIGQMKVDLRFEEERTTDKHTARNDDGAAIPVN
jgi:hypothetical protein